MERFDWGDHKACKTEMFIALIGLFAAYGQDVLPYHVAGIESNDKLYAGDPAYSAELEVVVGDTVNVRAAVLEEFFFVLFVFLACFCLFVARANVD